MDANNHLSWNEDDNDTKGRRDSNKPGNNGGNRQGPPDLDELFKKAQKWFSDIVSDKKKPDFGSGNFNFKKDDFDKQGKTFLAIFVAITVLFLAIIGFYKVEPGEQAVNYRFGKYIGIQGPGPHWLLPGVYSKEIVNTSVVHQKNFEEDLITKDVDLVTVAVAVQYKINHLQNYLFKVRSAEDSLSEASKSAIRQVVAGSTLDQVLSTRGIGDQIRALVEQNLNYYQAGLEIRGVEILSVLPPQQVKEAFNDAIQAQEDEIRYQNEAEAYERKVVPVAEGHAARIIQDANTYVAQTVLAAEGDVSKFNAILPEYSRAKDVTRNRLYLGAIEKTLKATPKIFVDSKANNVLVLPLDKFNLTSALQPRVKATSKSENQLLLDDADSSMSGKQALDERLSREPSKNSGDDSSRYGSLRDRIEEPSRSPGSRRVPSVARGGLN